ncbi:uncharacterized protein LOC126892869 [Diabrotica virgifera virgifera]|uniref:Uncharacterized protein n=1 Tax=Diabrotica virgifera virgifera TaxID=50390 RepID=A0ABM5L885_DIAVI|nr:uncharacterized protein LOC126892869 [Diabrotica virgifera virgifera]
MSWKLLRQFNAVFGWPIFLFLWRTSIYMVNNIIVHLTILIFLAMSCESVERIGKEIVNTCYQLREKEQDVEMKQQLLDLAIYTEQWKPTFSAAGFFDFNQRCLNVIFSSLINYLVIILQFDITIKQNAH